MTQEKLSAENALCKTYVFKAKCENSDIISFWKPAAEEYCAYYNRLSQWIADNLLSMKIGDLANYISNHDSKYYEAVTDDKKKDLPLYKIFQKGFGKQAANNALYCVIDELNPERYDGNLLGLNTSNYRRSGYVAQVLSNFRTKMSSLKTNVRWKRFDVENIDEDTLKKQTIYEVDRYGIESLSDFDDCIDILRVRDEDAKLREKITRLECLRDYYAKNEAAIKNDIARIAIANLQEFGGCVRNSKNTLTIRQQDFTLEKVGNTSFNLKLCFNKKTYNIGLFGNRQVVKYVNNERVDIVNIVSNHGDTITFNIKNGELFVHLTSYVKFEKEVGEIKNIVGVDVNIKHMMLATSIVDDGRLNGYVNLYRELVNDADFVSTFGDNKEDAENIELYRQMSKSVNFGLLETEWLFERVVDQWKWSSIDKKLIEREKAVAKVFDRIVKNCKDQHIVDYVNYVKMLRAKYKAYFIVKEKYYEKQHEYDEMMGFIDESTDSKDKMDKRRSESPFFNTVISQELLDKLTKIERDIIGCRDNIVTYVFNVFKNNGYNTVSLEYLDSSQFRKSKMPTPNSLLKFHNFDGKTKDEVEKIIEEKKFKKSHYLFEYGENGKLSNIMYSIEGNRRQKYINFKNLIIKVIHFADIKDKFIQLCNNNEMNIVLCPAAFTSQMDSLTHSLYYVESVKKDKKGKMVKGFVLAGKYTVRKGQEKHLNGLNADFNSSCNLQYIASNNTLREAMCTVFKPTKQQKYMYCAPAWNIKDNFKKNVSGRTLNTFTKLGNIRYGMINENGMFVETGDN